jgi:hypothetical protein
MTWAKFDDAFWSHPKTIRAGNEAVGAFVRMVCYCAQYLTDGAVSAATAREIARPKVIEKLLEVGMLEVDGDGYRVHGYLERNPSRLQVEAERAAKTQRQNRWREARAQETKTAPNAGNAPRVDASTAPSQDASKDAAPSRPVPTRTEEEIRNTSSPTREFESNDVQPLALEEPKTGADAPASASAGGVVVELFKHWQRVHAHPQAKLDAKRRRAIERAVKSHGVDVVRAAIDGCAKSAFHKGQNERGAVYDDLTLILRDASKIESFAALAPKAEPKPRPVLRTVANDPFAVSPFPKSFYERKAAGQ